MIVGTVHLELRDVVSGRVVQRLSRNIVTEDGDVFYAQRAAGEAPTNSFHTGVIGLGTDGVAPIKGANYSFITVKVTNGEKAFEGGYPKSNDQDAANTGKGADVVTYKTVFSAGEANDTDIDRVYISETGATGTDPVLMYALVPAFTKTSNETLTVYVNHKQSGV